VFFKDPKAGGSSADKAAFERMPAAFPDRDFVPP